MRGGVCPGDDERVGVALGDEQRKLRLQVRHKKAAARAAMAGRTAGCKRVGSPTRGDQVGGERATAGDGIPGMGWETSDWKEWKTKGAVGLGRVGIGRAKKGAGLGARGSPWL